MKRNELARPRIQYMIDWNSEPAYAAAGEPVRAYPRLIPVPFRSVSSSSDRLTLQPWRASLRIYPQLWAVVGRDVAVGEGKRARDAVAGLGLGLGILDDAILTASPGASPRDASICHWYSLYSDSCQILSEALVPDGPIEDVTLIASSPTLGTVAHPLSEILFDAGEVLVQMSSLNSFTKGEWFSLGAAGAPVTLHEGQRFAKHERLTVDGDRLGSFSFEVEDLRDPTVRIPTWEPRQYAVRRL